MRHSPTITPLRQSFETAVGSDDIRVELEGEESLGLDIDTHRADIVEDDGRGLTLEEQLADMPSLCRLVVSPDDVHFELEDDSSRLGRGSYGIVYRGVLRGELPVAGKVPLIPGHAAEKMFLHEAHIMQLLGEGSNIVQVRPIPPLSQTTAF